ncbi:MAG: ABC transporter ATP-binding protein [Dehalococcoidales bacterium]|nr:ABC transporter ATP-binding protein [Dehalococcoidales bacterium]
MSMLEGKGVTRHFGGLTAVSNVDFNVERGEIVGLIGPNGAGKTTLFNLVSAALSTQQGTITFKDIKITGMKPHQICRLGIARTFQSVKIFPNVSVLENVLLGALFGKSTSTSSDATFKEVEEILDFVGLSAIKLNQAKGLTLVNQKRVEVARALATDPELLLLDELMAGLNHTEISETMGMVSRIRDKGITILMIEHVMKAIMSICDRIIVLHHGETIAVGTPEEVSTSKKVIEVYLGG